MTVLVGCETLNMTKEQLGGVIGGAVGGVLGNTVSKNRREATAIGVLVGAFVGSRIGKDLDDYDRQQLALATLAAARDGTDKRWQGGKSGINGAVRVVDTQKRTETVRIPVLKSQVERVPSLDLIGDNYKSTQAANVRGGPGTDYVRVDGLAAGEIVTVIGQVKDEKWFLVSKDEVGRGFVHTSLLRPTATESPQPSGESIPRSAIQSASVSADKVCRTVEQTVTLADGSQRAETVTACQGPAGWSVAPAA